MKFFLNYLEESLYKKLIGSYRFNKWVKWLYDKSNNIESDVFFSDSKTSNYHTFTPTRNQRIKAFLIIWKNEFKKIFKI